MFEKVLLSLYPLGRKITPEPLKPFLARLLRPNYVGTLFSNERLEQLLSLLEKCIEKNLDGNIIECGVYRGGTTLEMAKKLKALNSKKIIYALDTFEGHPYDRTDFELEYAKKHLAFDKKTTIKGELSDTDLEKIQSRFEKYGIDNVIFLKGLFEESFPKIINEKFCFACIQADLYIGIKQSYEFLKDRMVKGGIIALEDYERAYSGGTRAAHEVFGEDSIIHTKKGLSAYWIK